MKQKAKRELLHVKVEGMNYHLDGGGQKIFFRGEWLEVMADQEGFLYIHPSGQKTIYLDDESQPEDLKKEPAGELFTPGEWYVVENYPTEERHDFQIACNCKSGNGSRQIAQVVKRNYSLYNDLPTLAESKANAYLLAQAKNMYFAMKKIKQEAHKVLQQWSDGKEESVSEQAFRNFCGACAETIEPILQNVIKK